MGVYGSPELHPNLQQQNTYNNNLIYCERCGTPFSKHLRHCPSCGKIKNGIFYNRFWFWFWLMIFVFGFIIYSTWYGAKLSTSSNLNTNVITEDIEEYKSRCEALSYEDVARDPEGQRGKYAQFYGEVQQIVDETNTHILFLLSVEGGTISVSLKQPTTPRILEHDFVTLYGRMDGLQDYKNIFGVNSKYPSLQAYYYTIQ